MKDIDRLCEEWYEFKYINSKKRGCPCRLE